MSQHQTEIVVHEKRPDGSWAIATHHSGSVEIRAIGCQLPFSEVYEDLPSEP